MARQELASSGPQSTSSSQRFSAHSECGTPGYWTGLSCSIMVAFDPGTDLSRDLAFRLLINTSVTLFWRSQNLDETSAWLTDHGYQVTRLDAGNWATEHDLHRDIAATLNFPD